MTELEAKSGKRVLNFEGDMRLHQVLKRWNEKGGADPEDRAEDRPNRWGNNG